MSWNYTGYFTLVAIVRIIFRAHYLKFQSLQHRYGCLIFKLATVPGQALQGRHYERDGDSYHQRLDCLLNCLFRHRSKKTSKLRVTGLCEGNPRFTGGFLSQSASNAENVSIWWRHRGWEDYKIVSQQWPPGDKPYCTLLYERLAVDFDKRRLQYRNLLSSR